MHSTSSRVPRVDSHNHNTGIALICVCPCGSCTLREGYGDAYWIDTRLYVLRHMSPSRTGHYRRDTQWSAGNAVYRFQGAMVIQAYIYDG